MTAKTSQRDIRAEAKENMRRGLLEIASRLLEQEGASALSMRRIAAEAGCSTTVLYTLFGGKEALAEGLYFEGFERLDAALAELETSDALEQLKALNRRYRQVALANATHYAVMFERPIPEFQTNEKHRARAARSMTHLLNAVQQCIDEGYFRPADHEEVTLMALELWTLVHGLVSVELAAFFPDKPGVAEQVLEKAMADLFTAWSQPSA